MTREERDYFEQQLHRQFRQAVIGGAVAMGCVGAYLFYMLRGGPERALMFGTGAVALYLVLVSISAWRLRRPASKWPSRVATFVSVVPIAIVVRRNAPTLIGFVTDALPMAVAVSGVMIMAVATMRRRGTKEFCTACQYEKGKGASERCPECGTRWNRPGATVRGERTASIPGVVGGLLVLGAGLTIGWASIRYRAEIMRFMPRGALLSHLAYAHWMEADEIVALLAAMEIPPDDVRRAADRILHARAENQFGVASIKAMDWVASQWHAGVLDDAVMERFAGESAELSLRLAGPSWVGTPLTIQVASVSRHTGRRYTVVVAVESIEVEGGTDAKQELMGPMASVLYPSLIDTPLYPQYAISASFTPDSVGARRATLKYWLIVTDGQPGLLQWTDEGGACVPTLRPSGAAGNGPPIWSKRYTTTLEFTVEP